MLQATGRHFHKGGLRGPLQRFDKVFKDKKPWDFKGLDALPVALKVLCKPLQIEGQSFENFP